MNLSRVLTASAVVSLAPFSAETLAGAFSLLMHLLYAC